MKERLKNAWKDPVWSKVIATILIGAGLILYNFIFAFVTQLDFKTSFFIFWNLEIKLWIVLLIIFMYFIIPISSIFKNKENKFDYDDKSLNLDVQLFNKIKNEIVTQDQIYWLRTNNFAGYSFTDEKLNPFDILEIESKKADFEFLNPNIEKVKRELTEEIISFNSFLLPNIFRDGKERLGVPSEWELEQSDRFWKAVDGIHERAQIVSKKYDEFIKIGRRILKV